MSFPKPTNGYDRMADPKLEAKANLISSLMEGNPYFPDPNPLMDEVNAAITAFSDALLKAGTGDRVAVTEKNEKKAKLAFLLNLLSFYVVYTAKGDRTKIATAGISVSKDSSPVEITKPEDLKVLNSNQAGELLVSVKRVKGGVAYMYQYTTDPSKEDSWQNVTCSTSKCKLTGLKPGTTYYIRVAAVGHKEQILFSDTVSRVAA